MATKTELAGQTSSSFLVSILGMLTHDPLTGCVVQATQPIMAEVFNKCIQSITNRKKQRAVSFLSIAAEKIKMRIDNDERPINILSLNEAEKIDINDFLDSIIKTAIEDPETKKTKLYGVMLANMLFYDKLEIGNYIGLIRIVNTMTYRDICLIKILKGLGVIYGGKWSQNNVSIDTNMVIVGIKRLERIGLTDKNKPFSLGAPLDNLSLNTTGLLLYDLMELKDIDDKEISDLKTTVNKLNK